MYITKMKKSVAGCLLVITSFLLIAEPVLGAAQEFKTLELVRTYQSKEAVHSAYPEQFPLVEKISQNGDSFRLATPQKERLKTFEIESLTETERQTLQTSNKAEPVIKTGTMRWLSNDRTMLLEADVTVNVRESGQLQEGDVNTKTLTLYNARGEVITQLAPVVSSIEVSPTRQNFVAYTYNVYDMISDILYFYDMNGTLLNEQKIIEEPRITYSQNGEFVQVYSDSDHNFAIFTKNGDPIYQGNYVRLIPNVRSALWNVHTSEQAEYMLLGVDLNIYLYTRGEKFLWKNATSGFDVADCLFFSKHEKIALQIATGGAGDDRYNLQIHSLTTGEMLDKISGIAEIRDLNGHLLIKKEGSFYEYQLQ